jgi:MFS family permease
MLLLGVLMRERHAAPPGAETLAAGAGMSPPDANKATGAFAPLRNALFAVLWGATVLGNTGSFMRDVASGWLATDLSRNPSTVAMVQAASTLPVFLLAIPAGALSDIVDRRKLLMTVQIFLAAVSATLATLVLTGALTATTLIGLTFLGGIGAALVGPTWQSIVPELVPKADLRAAVALNSLGFNIARAIGPAAGGLLLATAGAAFTYGADVVSYLFVIAALIWWKRAPNVRGRLTENLGGAMRAGFRFALASADLKVILLKAAVFFLLTNVAWSLLPIIARTVLKGDAAFYGVLLGAIGAGAVLGAVGLPWLRKLLDADGMLLAASLLICGVLAALFFAPPKIIGIALALVFGLAWIVALTTLNATTQAVLPNWVRGRGLAVYLMTMNGAMTAGSAGWGQVAEHFGVPSALLAGSIGLAIMAVAMFRLKLPEGAADLAPAHHWPDPESAGQFESDRGPVLVTVEYRIAEHDREAFLPLLHDFGLTRRRDGAYAWGISESVEDPGVVLEWFFVESWAEHLRQHGRVSRADADVQDALKKFHAGDGPPKARHYLAFDGRPAVVDVGGRKKPE